MSRVRERLARIRGLLSHRDAESRLCAEIEQHLALQIEDNIARGMSPEDARRAAMWSTRGVCGATGQLRMWGPWSCVPVPG